MVVVLPINYVFYSKYKYNTNNMFLNLNSTRHKDHGTIMARDPFALELARATTSIIDRNLLFHNPFSYYQNIQIILLMQDH